MFYFPKSYFKGGKVPVYNEYEVNKLSSAKNPDYSYMQARVSRDVEKFFTAYEEEFGIPCKESTSSIPSSENLVRFRNIFERLFPSYSETYCDVFVDKVYYCVAAVANYATMIDTSSLVYVITKGLIKDAGDVGTHESIDLRGGGTGQIKKNVIKLYDDIVDDLKNEAEKIVNIIFADDDIIARFKSKSKENRVFYDDVCKSIDLEIQVYIVDYTNSFFDSMRPNIDVNSMKKAGLNYGEVTEEFTNYLFTIMHNEIRYIIPQYKSRTDYALHANTHQNLNDSLSSFEDFLYNLSKYFIGDWTDDSHYQQYGTASYKNYKLDSILLLMYQGVVQILHKMMICTEHQQYSL